MEPLGAHRGPIWMAVIGLAVMGLESILIAPASASLTSALVDRPFLGLESVLTQVLLVGVGVTVLTIGLLRESRLAFVVALLIGLVPVVGWFSLLAAHDPLTIHHVTVRLAASSLLVLAGIGLSWPVPRGHTGSHELR